AHADDNEMMFAIPAGKLAGLLTNLKKFQEQPYAYRNTSYFIQPDFPRPDFYKAMFKQWGLEDY
ncbi:MAG: hypothetical protein JXA17_03155, partial [Dehalococcoidales bacterium]|nr:hypothetical protein [Dehalococcoidales bacterium]